MSVKAEGRGSWTKRNKYKYLFWFWRAESENTRGSVFRGDVYIGQIHRIPFGMNYLFRPFFRGVQGDDCFSENEAASWVSKQFDRFLTKMRAKDLADRKRGDSEKALTKTTPIRIR